MLGTYTHTGDLASGGKYTQSQSITLPAQLQGSYFITVVADSGQAVLEPDTRADSTSPAKPITVTSPYAPLATSAVTAPASASAGSTFVASWTVTNNGTGAHQRLVLAGQASISPTGTTPQASDILLSHRTRMSARWP